MFKMLMLYGELSEMMECVLGMKFWFPCAWTRGKFGVRLLFSLKRARLA